MTPRHTTLFLTLALTLITVQAAASSPISLVPFVPRDARTVVGLDLTPSPYEDFGGAAMLFLDQSVQARKLMDWIDTAKLEVTPDAALSIENDRTQNAIILELDEMRDSHWLRIEALMKLDGLTRTPGRGGDVWSLNGDDPMAVTRLNERAIVVGHPNVVRAILEGVRSRRKPRGDLAEMLGQVPPVASAWFIALPLDARAKPKACEAGASGHLILDDGLLAEVVWRCVDVASADALRQSLKTDLQGEPLTQELASVPALRPLLAGALIQRVGDDVMLVLNATDGESRKVLDQMRGLGSKTAEKAGP